MQKVSMCELNEIFKEKWKMEKPKEIGIDAVINQWDRIVNSDKLLKELRNKNSTKPKL